MTTEISNSEFYLATVGSTRTVHDSRDDAINTIAENINGIDPEDQDLSITSIEIEGEKWNIQQLPSDQVAILLVQEVQE